MLPAERRALDLAGIRRTFGGRVGAPSAVEGTEEVLPSAVLDQHSSTMARTTSTTMATMATSARGHS